MPFAKPFSGTFVAFNAAENDPDDNFAARGDYAINSGDQNFDEYFPGPETLREGDTPSFWQDIHKKLNIDINKCSGISFERSEIIPDQIRDGATYTIMLGEKYLNPDHYLTGLELYDNESLYTDFNNDNFPSAFAPPRETAKASAIHCRSAAYTSIVVILFSATVQTGRSVMTLIPLFFPAWETGPTAITSTRALFKGLRRKG